MIISIDESTMFIMLSIGELDAASISVNTYAISSSSFILQLTEPLLLIALHSNITLFAISLLNLSLNESVITLPLKAALPISSESVDL